MGGSTHKKVLAIAALWHIFLGYGTILGLRSVNSLLPRAALGHWEVAELSCCSQELVFREYCRLGSVAAFSQKRAVLLGEIGSFQRRGKKMVEE